MFEPNKDRVDYGELLSCPENYKLDFAIGTTYSLDLDALVGISLALGLGAETDSDLVHNPVCLLEALRLTGDNIALFCEGGQIHLPSKPSPLYILLEQMVYQITTEKVKGLSHYPSFHPKFWLLRFLHCKTGFVKYRVAVMSRNLTFDQSWDVTFSMEGEKSSKRSSQNSPVCDFLKYLLINFPDSDMTNNKRKKIEAITKELPYIAFDLQSKEFNDFEFIPVGIPNGRNSKYDITASQYSLFNERFDELLVITPFLSKEVIRKLNDNASGDHNSNILITRADSLAKLSDDDCSNFSIYTLRDEVIDGESVISEESDTVTAKHDIHAKLYMTRKGSSSELYLGSLNASQNALYGNIEFMIKLSSKNRYLNLDKMKEALFNVSDGENPFIEVYPPEGAKEEESPKLDKYIKELCRCPHHAIAEETGERYRLTVSFESLPHSPEDIAIEISPLLSKKTAVMSEEVIFEDIELTKLSEFYKVKVSNTDESVCRVIKIDTEGIPEDRERKIVADVINNKEAFYRYIAFLLGDNYVSSSLEIENMDLSGTALGDNRKPVMLPSLYEKMLKTAAISPEKLKEIGYLIDSIAEDNVIPEFEKLYSTFKKAVKL